MSVIVLSTTFVFNTCLCLEYNVSMVLTKYYKAEDRM